jgi:hypothetical protein
MARIYACRSEILGNLGEVIETNHRHPHAGNAASHSRE